MSKNITSEKWDIVITSDQSGISFGFADMLRYKDLLMMFVKKDIVTVYKQTILGPLWFIIQPLFTTVMYYMLFNSIAGIGTGGVPPILFYMMGITLWNYFSETLNITSKTFIENASIFGKVYFPRIVLPVSKSISGFIKFLIQFGLVVIIWLYYFIFKHAIHPNINIVFAPFFLFVIVLMGLSWGILISSLTTKYRDLIFLVSFGVQLAMYATPVIIPLSHITGKKRLFFLLNPLTSLFEGFKSGFLGESSINWNWVSYSVGFTIVLFLLGMLSFNRVERRFIDTV